MKIKATLLLSLCFAYAALAQSGSGVKKENDTTPVNQKSVNFSIPDSPAFDALGLNPENITHPATPREFASQLLNGFDQNGHFQSGIAIDTDPVFLLAGRNLTIQKYAHAYWRIPANTQFSIATVKGVSSDDPSAKLALGIHLLIYNRRDPRLDDAFLSQMAAATKQVMKTYPKTHPKPELDANGNEDPMAVKAWEDGLRDEVDRATKSIRDAFHARDWNATKLAVAAAPSWNSPAGSLSSLNWNGGGFWGIFAYGFEDVPKDANWFKEHALVAFYAKYRNNETVTDPKNSSQTFVQNSSLGGLRLLLGSQSSNGSFEAVYQHNHPKVLLRPNEDFWNLAFGVEHQVNDGLWLNFSFGGQTGRGAGTNALFVRSNFKWGTSAKSLYSPTEQ